MYEWAGAGITSVKISGMENRIIDLSSNKWEYKVQDCWICSDICVMNSIDDKVVYCSFKAIL